MPLVSEVYPPEVWAMESLMVLRDQLVMARLVHRDFEPEVANRGDVIHTRKPQKLPAYTWSGQSGTGAGDQINVHNLTAHDLTITLDTLVYVAFLVEDKDEATSIKDLRAEFMLPAMDPIAQRIDDDIMDEFTADSSADVHGNDVAQTAFDTPIGLDTALDEDDIVTARQALNLSQCPLAGRVCVVSAEHEADLLRSDLFVPANTSGSTEALVNGSLGRKFGFDFYMSQNVPTGGTDGIPQSLAFHRNALAFVNRPLVAVPATLGASSAFASLDRISIRVTSAYDIRYKGVTMSLDVLYGVQLLDANLAIILRP
jgi:N4-gp56 family major capsid protein